MPIKKIIVSEEMIKKNQQDKEEKCIPVYFIAIPRGTSPRNVGDYVLREVRHNHPEISLSATTGTAISFSAQEGAKEGWGLKGVKLSIALPPSLELEWGKG